jgi:hypothetical protein
MKPPILVVSMDSMDVDFYDNPDDAARSMEAIDVVEGLYTVFDGDGLPIRVLAPAMRKVLWVFQVEGSGIVTIEDGPDDPAASAWLEKLLRDRLRASGRPAPEDATMAQLIDAVRTCH